MSAEDPRVQRLQSALDELVAADVGELLGEARVDARARVRRILADALVDSMLDSVRRQLAQQASTPSASTASPAPSGELAWYVYGVIAADAAPAWTLPGIDRAHGVTSVREGDVAAVVSRVALEDFGEAQLREHLADMAWVEATARAHEGVLEQTRAQVTVVPTRMCTVYRTEDGVRDMLRRQAVALTEALDHLEGKTEMGVKVFAGPEPARAPEETVPELEGPGAGAAYMERRRRERDRGEQAAGRLEQATDEIHERLCALSAEARLTPPQRPEASGHPGAMIQSGVYLVADDALDRFRREVSSLQDRFGSHGLELELTGPWPAYNFVPNAIGATW
jgi:hypothetical protein